MRGVMIRILAVMAILGAAALPARAVDDAAAGAIRGTIQGQLEAFRRGDAGAAYGFAAPTIQRLFPSEDVFMQMVRQGYAPVYRPRSYAFERTREVEGQVAQEVRIVDEDGGNWLAFYSMELQPDGTWKISGCRLVKAPENSV